MAAELLTSVARVKMWLSTSTPPTSEDALLGALVSSASRYVLNNLNRDFLINRAVTERRDGLGRPTMMLRNWPVTDYTSLSVDGGAIVPSSPIGQGAGYFVNLWDGAGFGEMTSVELYGSSFTRGRANVVHTYRAGYRIAGEAATIPGTPFQVTAAAPDGPWASDLGVTIAGVAATRVAASPTAGQYTVSAVGLYTFALADVGKTAALTYGYVPGDIETACFEIVGEQYKYRERIGQNSKSVGGEVISFSTRSKSAFVEDLLRPHRRVVPL